MCCVVLFSGCLAGHPVIMSSCWYLDWSSTWQDFLKVEELERVIATTSAQEWRLVAELNDATDPVSAVTVVPPQLLVGGEVAMWTEKVDVSNFECRVWPRAGAVAARLWSGRLQAEDPNVMHGFARYSTVLSSAVASTEVSIALEPASGKLTSSPSMCPKIAESTQRPIHIDAWKIAQVSERACQHVAWASLLCSRCLVRASSTLRTEENQGYRRLQRT